MSAAQSTLLIPAAFTRFGDLLRFLRRRAQLTQRDLSIAVGYNFAQICRLEQGQRLPDRDVVAAMTHTKLAALLHYQTVDAATFQEWLDSLVWAR